MQTRASSTRKRHTATAVVTNRAGTPVPRLLHRVWDVVILVQQGVLRPMRPDKLLRISLAWLRWGLTLPFGYAVSAIRAPDRPALIDERGALSFLEVEQRTTRLANGLRSRGVRSGHRVAILCRNHHGLIEAVLACGKIGADVVLLNTGLAPGQLGEVLARQQVNLLIKDQEFAGHEVDGVPVVLAWTEGTTSEATLEHLVSSSPAKALPRRPRHSRLIVLTSGTTGTPKGAQRPDPAGLSPAATMMSRIPLRSGERILLSAPAFHTWGIAGLQLGTVLGATLVLRRRFDPQEALAAIQRHQCTSMFAVPVMLQRLLELPAEVRTSFDTASVRIVACSGSALPPELATHFQRTFGDVLYNVYGSTEVSWVSIATPRDLREEPTTAGRPPRGTALRIINDAGDPVRTGETGRIFAGNDMLFEGYTNGKKREIRNGLMATGDLGRRDASGRLFVVGREDDMIVSGGENVYPQETEEVIDRLTDVREAAVIGVDDADFGQRLVAFVVLRDGSSLDAEAIRDAVRERLPKFAVPRNVVFMEELPRNATGKVVPHELRHHLGG